MGAWKKPCLYIKYFATTELLLYANTKLLPKWDFKIPCKNLILGKMISKGMFVLIENCYILASVTTLCMAWWSSFWLAIFHFSISAISSIHDKNVCMCCKWGSSRVDGESGWRERMPPNVKSHDGEYIHFFMLDSMVQYSENKIIQTPNHRDI